jgi:xanthine dehydrogenase accessory factor
MKKQLIIWQLIDKSLQQQVPVLLLYVLQSEGSSPGRQGFFMAVNANGETAGSIGGGIMEHKFVEMARQRLQAQSTTEPIHLKKQFHNKSAAANQSGMICSGEQTILLYQVLPKDITTVQHIITSLQQYGNGTLQLSPDGLQFSSQAPDTDHYFLMSAENDWLYREKTGYKNHLYIIGAGHCGLALSQMMCEMDFFIHLYDDRPDVKTLVDNSYAHEKKIISDYNQLREHIPSGSNIYVVVMTVGYRTDDMAIRALWDRPFRYFGVLGSKSKIEKMFADYEAEGIPSEKLQVIHAPVGLAIHSQTPEEIAVSIAAEIIQEKNSK